MEIKIDTQKDSKDSIKKVIDLLKSFVGEENVQIEERSSSETDNYSNESVFNLFDDEEEKPKEKPKKSKVELIEY